MRLKVADFVRFAINEQMVKLRAIVSELVIYVVNTTEYFLYRFYLFTNSEFSTDLVANVVTC